MFKKYPSIEQYRNVVKKVRLQHDYVGKDENEKAIYVHSNPYPVLSFHGTVKLHGTNSAIGFNEDHSIFTQSRNRLLTLEDDNAGFASFISELPKDIIDILKFKNTIFYGEWCGGSIQKKVALNKLAKMFVIFSVKGLCTDNEWYWCDEYKEFCAEELKQLNSHKIYFIDQFEKFDIDIDFNYPEMYQNKLIEITNNVGDCCPVAREFGVDGIGEGVVWKCITSGFESSAFWFKVKDERHQSSRIKTLSIVDVEKVNSIKEFVDNVVTESRLNQGLEYLKEMKIPIDIKNTGDFLRWVFNDILKEESDTMESNNITKKDIGSPISRKAKTFWMDMLNSNFD